MKRILLLVAALAASTSAPAAPKLQKPTTATIDPRALALLARVSEKYASSSFYSAESESSFSREGIPAPDKRSYHLYTSNAGDLELRLTQKGVAWHLLSDGKFLLATRSDQPKKYRLDPVTAPRLKREIVLLSAGPEGFVADALTHKLGNLLLNPQLQSLALGQPVVEQRVRLRPIVLVQYNGSGSRRERTVITIHVAPDDTIRLATMRTVDPQGTAWLWSEKHWNIKIGQGIPKPVRVAPPAGFTRDETPVKSPA